MDETRRAIDAEFNRCVHHDNPGQVADTCSFARAERVIGREYHGRFLIELLQNAADAWRKADPERRSGIDVRLSSAPALLVANRGDPVTAGVVIGSIGQIGATTKDRGTAIGHKGIGFKSVLELSLVPEIYSRRDASGPFELCVRYDPREALAAIRDNTADGQWDDWVTLLADFRAGEPALNRIPVLRYPQWSDRLPADVERLISTGEQPNTIIRLPYDAELAGRLGFASKAAWRSKVTDAFGDLTDEILLLLGTFDSISVDDEEEAPGSRIERLDLAPGLVAAGSCTTLAMRVEFAAVDRDGERSSQWALFRRQLPEADGLEAEIAVGVRLHSTGPGCYTVVDAGPEPGRTPFHLFFPTHIPTGLPFLLHGYFEVDAGRTGFHRGSAAKNQAVLDGLEGLVADAVAALAERPDIDLAPLASLLGTGGEPGEEMARGFREKVLDRLDGIAWVPALAGGVVRPVGGGPPPAVTPAQILAVWRGPLHERLSAAFPPDYVWSAVGRAFPSQAVDETGRLFLAGRAAAGGEDPLWATLGLLLRPGSSSPWAAGSDADGFAHLVDLLDTLRAEDTTRCTDLTTSLRDDPAATIVPVVAPDGGCRLVPPPPEPTRGGSRTRMVMARIGGARGDRLSPPPGLEIDFLAGDRLTAEQVSGPAKLLGVREYAVETVLDRIASLEAAPAGDEELLRFLWRFLAREHRNDLGLNRVLRRRGPLDPGQWFWWQPASARAAEVDRDRQIRLHALQHVLLPTTAGSWAPACHLAFGAAWADWLEEREGDRAAERAAAYRDLQELAPGRSHLVSGPAELARRLGATELIGDGEVLGEHGTETGDEPDGTTADDGAPKGGLVDPISHLALHAFVLRLGVWEVPPVEALVERSDRAIADRVPWAAERAEQLKALEYEKGWPLEGTTYRHPAPQIAEDFRFRWPLAGGGSPLVRCLNRAVPLLRRMDRLMAFCNRCSGRHRTRFWTTEPERHPSFLAWQLQNTAWLPARRGGAEEEIRPTDAWWDPASVEHTLIRHSPLQFLALATPEVSPELRAALHIPALADADAPQTERLLRGLQAGFDAGAFPEVKTSGSVRQAYISLHRTLYARLAATDREAARMVIEKIGVLAELGEYPDYHQPADTRHDNGDFARLRRYFVGEIPFVALAKDQGPVANELGVERFHVVVAPETRGVETDCTRDVADFSTGLAAEILALLVHHSLGGRTVEIDSEEFHRRARRLSGLQIVRVDDLVLALSVPKLAPPREIGLGSTQEIHLERADTPHPRIIHDFGRPTWRDDLRRRIHEPLAVLAGNAAFADTIAMLLQTEPEARPEFLLEHGIGETELDKVRRAIGVVDDDIRAQEARWWAAVTAAFGLTVPAGDDPPGVLLEGGVSPDQIARLVELGGGEDARRNPDPDGALAILDEAGVDLGRLHEILIAGGDPGLRPGVAAKVLKTWTSRHGPYAAWLLARGGMDEEAARGRKGTWAVPDACRPFLRPDPVAVIIDILQDLHRVGFEPDATRLADLTQAREEIVRLAGVGADEVEAGTAALWSTDGAGRDRIVRANANEWRQLLRLALTATRTTDNEPSWRVRDAADDVGAGLPHVDRPSDLAGATDELDGHCSRLAGEIRQRLDDRVTAPVMTEDELAQAWDRYCPNPGRLRAVAAILHRAVSAQVAELQRLVVDLEAAHVGVTVPPGGPRPPDPEPGERRKVSDRKVIDSPRRKKIGDQGEAWAVAQVTRNLLALGAAERRRAVEQILQLLHTFEGAASIHKATAAGEAALAGVTDDDDFLAHLPGLLHVSRYSDGYGFDVLGWMAPTPGQPQRSLCLEVKAGSAQSFFMSASEWRRAKELGAEYALFVVHLAPGNETAPRRLDLLADPVQWEAKGKLHLVVENWQGHYGGPQH